MSHKYKQFVIQEHRTATEVHWDLMLESGPALQTYRLDKSPEQILHNHANAVKIFDHRGKFLKYQGPLSKGQASVRIVETGTFRALPQGHDCIELNLKGQTLKGKFILIHSENDKWILLKK